MDTTARILKLPAATPAVPEPSDLRALVRSLIEGGSLTQSKIARESSVSTTRLSQWLAGTYPGDNAALESQLAKWVESRAMREAEAKHAPKAPTFVETPSAKRILSALRFAHFANDFSVIYGASGLGKTLAIRHYVERSASAFAVTMTPATAGVVPALEEIAQAVGAGVTSGGAAKLHRSIVERLRGTAGLLIIDEAQHLGASALDQIRAIFDATDVGLALVGNEFVFSRMTSGHRAAMFDRLRGRIGKRLHLARPTLEDADAIAEAWGVEDSKARQLAATIASQPGGLRTLTKGLRGASTVAAQQGAPVAFAHLHAAWQDLGGAV